MTLIICPQTGMACQITGCMGCAPRFPQQPANMGWQCPKCGRGNAPFVSQCPCGPQVTFTMTGGANG